MNRYLMISLIAVTSLGCGDSGGGADGGGPDMAASSNPTPPTLGAQIDRMGRPAINTALTNPFDIVAGMTVDQVKDAYNAEGAEAMWASKFAKNIATNLAILDGL